MHEQKGMIDFLLENGIFVSPDFFDSKTHEQMQEIYGYVKNNTIEEGTFIDDIYEKIIKRGDMEKSIDPMVSKIMSKPEKNIPEQIQKGNVEIVYSYDEEVTKKREIQDFVAYFNQRYKELRGMLLQRQEMQNLTSIGRLSMRKDSSNVAICGLVLDRTLTKNGNILLTLEDPTGVIKVLISKNKSDLIEDGKTIVEDEVIGIVGKQGDNIIFANSVLFPDVPASKELKKSPDEAYAVFLSDIHVGSDTFMEEEFKKFISWIQGDVGNEDQKRVANLVKYVFITGDLVDGVGIYPKMEDDLVIKDVKEQYKVAYEFIDKIPKNKTIIISPGNHDAMRLAEPQLKIPEQYAPDFYNMENVILVSNPACLKIHRSEKFEGFDVLMYHGYSYDHYYLNVDHIRLAKGMEKPDMIMKFLLKRRHLAPTYKSTQIIPDTKRDNLIISTIPDFFISGHVHRTGIVNYRNVSLICSSCFQQKTDFQEKVGHNPQPGRVPIVNLQTREVKMLRFY